MLHHSLIFVLCCFFRLALWAIWTFLSSKTELKTSFPLVVRIKSSLTTSLYLLQFLHKYADPILLKICLVNQDFEWSPFIGMLHEQRTKNTNWTVALAFLVLYTKTITSFLIIVLHIIKIVSWILQKTSSSAWLDKFHLHL